ncbi:MAG: hypothetical protein RL508_1084 [Actinomycetota bacterium]|jgi:hypothetical protein
MAPTPEHLLAAEEALAAANEVLPIFEKFVPGEDRPQKALQALAAWTNGEMSVSEVRRAAFDAHEAARNTDNLAARYAARACGQAASVAHVASHLPHVHRYAEKARAEVKRKH